MKLLAIGGPEHGKWLPYNDSRYYGIVVPKPRRMTYFSEGTALVEDLPTETIQYRVDKLGDPVTGNIKRVYVRVGLTDDEAMAGLKELLLEMFINSSVGEDM